MKKIVLMVVSVLSAVVLATEYTYTGTDGNWNTASNWSPEGVPDGGDTANSVMSERTARPHRRPSTDTRVLPARAF